MPEHKSLAAALLAFHKNPPHIALDGRNPHFKSPFATFKEVTSKTRPRLADEGLVVSQQLSHIDGVPALTTTLIHAASGEKIEATTPLLLGGKADPQSWGSAITYGKRYGWLAITGLVGDEDDDGNAATTNEKATAHREKIADKLLDHLAGKDGTDEPEFAPELPVAEAQEAFPTPGDGITDKQLKFLKMLATKLVKAADDENAEVDAFRAELDAKYGVTATKDLSKDQAKEVITGLKERALAAGLIEDRP